MEGNQTGCQFGPDCENTDLTTIEFCLKPTANHLKYLKAGLRGLSVIPENYLILNRAGVVVVTASCMKKNICKQHRDDLGIYWRRKKRTCAHPLHGQSTAKPDRGITPVMSREIWLRLQLVVPVGEAICRLCTDKHKKELSLGSAIEDEIRDKIQQMAPTSIEEDHKDTVSQSCDQSTLLCDDMESTEETAAEIEYTHPMNLTLSQGTISDTIDDETPFLSQATESDWSHCIKSQKDIFNEAMKALSGGTYPPLRSQPSQPLTEMKYVSKMYYIRQAKYAIELICENIAPGQSKELLINVVQSYQKSVIGGEKEKSMDQLTEAVIVAYNKSDDHVTKTQMLSIIVNKYTKSELSTLIEGLTPYKIDKARKHAATHGPGLYVAPPKISRVRLSRGKLQHFIEFISAPCYLQSVGFGSKHLKLSSGVEVKVPKVIRTMIASRLINAYNGYCQDNDIVPPSKSTLYILLKHVQLHNWLHYED